AVRGDRVERNAGEAQEASRIGGDDEGVDEGGLDQVEVGLPVDGLRLALTVQVRRLPLHSRSALGTVIVADPRRTVVVIIVAVMHPAPPRELASCCNPLKATPINTPPAGR